MVINFFLGTAAELIKLYPLVTRARARGWTVRLLATGQSATNLEAQMLDFGLDPAELVWIVPRARDLATARAALVWFARAWFTRSPVDMKDQTAVVHGDTLSTLVGARIARRAGARVWHVEAGLRSRRLLNPFPEEITRRLVSRLADGHAAPDAAAVANLRTARVRGEVIDTGGNTLVDAVRDGAVASDRRGFVLVNVHRFENVNSAARWRIVTETVLRAARTRPVVFIAHPQTRHRLDADPILTRGLRDAGVEIHDRVPFSKFLSLLKAADFLISDGGSNQEECSYLGVPCLLLREETERREGLDENCVLSRFDAAVIQNFLNAPEAFRRAPRAADVAPSDFILDHVLNK